MEKIEYIRLNVEEYSKFKNGIIECFKSIYHDNNEKCIDLTNKMGDYIIDKTAIVFSAIEGKNLIGFIWGYMIDSETIHITYFTIKSTFQKKGIGTRLIEKMINYAYNTNIYKIELNVNRDNFNAIKFYTNKHFINNELKSSNEKINMILYLKNMEN